MSKELDKSSNALKGIADGLTSVGTKMTAGITLPIIAAGTAMFKTFADFESVIVELGARTGATADEMKKMSDFALQMGRDTAFSATEAAQALLELTSSGSTAAEAMEQLPAVLDLAAAGALELGQAADGLTDILAAFSLDADEAANAADVLAQAAGASSATVSDLLNGFANVGPVAHQFGLSLHEAAAAMAVLAENGIKGAEAGTMIKSMLLNMTHDTDTVKGAWEQLGVSFYDAAGQARDLDEVFKDINAAMEDMSMEEQNRLAADLAGSYGIVAFNSLRASNGISSMQEAMAGAATASEVADARMNTMAGRMDSLMGSVETLGIVLGGLAAGPLNDLVFHLTNAVNALTSWAQANPALAQTAMIILAIVAAVGPLLIIFGQIAGAIVAIKAAFALLPAGFAIFSAAALPVIALVGAIIVALGLLIANWNQLGTTLSQIGAIAGKAMGGLFTGIQEGVWNAVKALGSAWAEMIAKATTAFTQLQMLPVLILTKMIATMSGLGGEIMRGLILGVSQKIVEFIAMVQKMAQDAANAVRRAFGIHSPSKVMMDIGKNVVAGFEKGVESYGGIGVNVPQVSGGSSAGPTLGLAGAGAGGGGATQIFNIYPAKGTSDEQAKEIMQKIAKASRKKGAKGF